MNHDRWQYVLTEHARRDLGRLSHDVSTRVIAALDQLVANENRNVRKLAGRGDEWRLRVGDYRVRYKRDHGARLVVVLHVRNRRDAYR